MSHQPEPPPPLPDLACAECARPITWSRVRKRYAHRPSGVVAVCDLDSDHVVRPDWEAADGVVCRSCRGEVVVESDRFVHVERSRDADHAADPGVPLS